MYWRSKADRPQTGISLFIICSIVWVDICGIYNASDTSKVKVVHVCLEIDSWRRNMSKHWILEDLIFGYGNWKMRSVQGLHDVKNLNRWDEYRWHTYQLGDTKSNTVDERRTAAHQRGFIGLLTSNVLPKVWEIFIIKLNFH